MAKLENLGRPDIVKFGDLMEEIQAVAGEEDIKDPECDGKTWFDWYLKAVNAILNDDKESFGEAADNMARLTASAFEERGE